MKTNHPVRWDKNRHAHFKIGLIVAILAVIFAFNWTVSPPKYDESTVEMKDLNERITVRTLYEDKKMILPPPIVKASEKIIAEEVPEFTESPAPEMVDTVIRHSAKQIDIGETNLISRENITPPPPPPPPPPRENSGCDFVKIVEDMPRFPGCEDELTKVEKTKCSNHKLLEFLQENIKYPSLARESGIEGTVVVSFIVEKDGAISKINVIRDIGGGCGDEAVRVVTKMPLWRSGRQRGRKVRVQFNLPVKFKLN